MKNEFFAFKNLDGEADNAELSIHDEIGFWGLRAKDFHAKLKSIKGKKLAVVINSPGGSVIDGYAIYNMLRASGKEVTVTIQGIAASIASVIAMAGNKIVMPENALMFIHNPLLSGATGNADELRKMATDLDKLEEGIQAIYEARTGADKAKIKKMMAAETLLTAKECMLLGFADEVIPENKAAAVANFKFGDYFPEIQLPSVATPAPVGHNKQENNTMTEAEKTVLDAANQRVSVLEGENTTLKNSVELTRNKAQQDATTAENTRKNAIKTFAAKYNKDGDLNEAIIEALAGATTVDEFKDKVLDVVNGRPATAAAKKQTDDKLDPDDKSDAALTKQYDACKTSGDRRKFLAENKAWARRQAK